MGRPRSQPVDQTPRRLTAVCLLGSLLLHGGAGVWLASAGVSGREAGGADAPDPKLEEDRQDEARLGLEKSDRATINWLGFADPTPHNATSSSLEQAALSVSPVGTPAPPANPDPSREPPQEAAPAASPSAAVEPTPERPVERAVEWPVERAAEQPADQEPTETEQSPAEAPAETPTETDPTPPTEAAPPAEAGEVPVADAADPESEAADPVAAEAEPAEPTESAAEPDEATEETPDASAEPVPEEPVEKSADEPVEQTSEQPAETTLEQSPVEAPAEQSAEEQPSDDDGAGEAEETTRPSPPAEQEGADSIPGIQSDRESTPTSKEMTLSDWGKPAAGEGIQVNPVRPRFPDTLAVFRRSLRATVLIDFGADGFVRNVQFETVTVEKRKVVRNTGSPEADRVLLNSVYNWTASGDEIEALRDKGADARIRIRMDMRFQP